MCKAGSTLGLQLSVLAGESHVCRPRHRNHVIVQEEFSGCHRKGHLARFENPEERRRRLDQDQKIVVEDGKIAAYRVNMKVTFILTDN